MIDRDALFAIEKEFWTGGSDYYLKHVDQSCLIAFNRQMAGVMSREVVAESAKQPNRWRNLSLEPKGFLEPAPGVAILTYEAKATRENGEPYAALVSTAYVERDDGWKMAFHQQTPLEDSEKR